jgi:hypothetical protein
MTARTLTRHDAADAAPAGAWTARIALVLQVWLATLAVTGAGAIAALLAPGVAPAGAPHATLHGTPAEAASILVANLRVLAAPIVLTAARWHRGRVTRMIGDATVLADLVVTPFLVGAALGVHGRALVLFLPHVPIEWAALSTAVAAWLSARRSTSTSWRAIAAYAATVVVLTAAAAIVETVAVPHVQTRSVQLVDGDDDEPLRYPGRPRAVRAALFMPCTSRYKTRFACIEPTGRPNPWLYRPVSPSHCMTTRPLRSISGGHAAFRTALRSRGWGGPRLVGAGSLGCGMQGMNSNCNSQGCPPPSSGEVPASPVIRASRGVARSAPVSPFGGGDRFAIGVACGDSGVTNVVGRRA